jgi:predicted adenylyl cyclase CyaB
MKKEIEVKIAIPKRKKALLIKRLTRCLKAKRLPGINQKTFGFFTPDGSSIKKGVFPRIRIDNGIPTMTVKVRENKKGDYFRRSEYTTGIDSLKDAVSIMTALGYTDCRCFSKTRTPFLWKKGIDLALDYVPGLGYFFEIEASEKEIENTIKLLGLENEKRITRAYLGLIEEKENKK